jgi:hypothetical protein
VDPREGEDTFQVCECSVLTIVVDEGSHVDCVEVEVARSLVYQIFIYLDLLFLSCNYLLQQIAQVLTISYAFARGIETAYKHVVAMAARAANG